jgi:hypothetical protein
MMMAGKSRFDTMIRFSVVRQMADCVPSHIPRPCSMTDKTTPPAWTILRNHQLHTDSENLPS